MTRQFVCHLEDVPKGTMKTFELEGEKKILIINADQNVFACQGVCPHQDVCLEEGLFDGEVLTCHQHLWQWKVAESLSALRNSRWKSTRWRWKTDPYS